jgi:hypothetical protein
MKKTTFLKILAVTLCMFAATTAFTQGGTTGPLTWNISGDTLTISGNGEMPDYENPPGGSNLPPWFPYKDLFTTLVMESGVTKIGDFAFFCCFDLTGSLTISNSIVSIGKYSFCSSGYTGTLTIPNSVTTIDDGAFLGCGFTGTLTIPNSVTMIGMHAFGSCAGFTGTLILPNSITSISEHTFNDCYGFTSLVIPDSVITIGPWAFTNCFDLSSISIGNSVTSIDQLAFGSCLSLSSITIPNSVTSIGMNAFQNCESLESVIIGNSVTSIGDGAFSLCNMLSSITTLAETPPNIAGIWTFHGVPESVLVHIPCMSYFKYKNAYGWKNFTNYVINGAATPFTTYYSTKCYTPYTDNNFTTPIYYPGEYYTSIPNANNCDSIICLTLLENPLPKLCMITVDDNYHNEIIWNKIGENAIFNIFREGQQSGNYNLVASINNGTNSWTDTESNARIRSYRYKISGVDTCGKESALSFAHKTMHLTINAGVNNSWNLIWTAYEGTEYSTYNIYRAKGNAQGPGTFELIGTMPGGNTSYSDFTASPGGYVYYMVEILLNEMCSVSKSGSTIKSNIATNNPGVGIASTALSNQISVYPNPTTGELTIDASTGSATNWTLSELVLSKVEVVEVFDVYGRKVGGIFPLRHSESSEESQTMHTAGGRGSLKTADGVTINISHLSAGLYFVKIQTEIGEVVRKVVKE